MIMIYFHNQPNGIIIRQSWDVKYILYNCILYNFNIFHMLIKQIKIKWLYPYIAINLTPNRSHLLIKQYRLRPEFERTNKIANSLTESIHNKV